MYFVKILVTIFISNFWLIKTSIRRPQCRESRWHGGKDISLKEQINVKTGQINVKKGKIVWLKSHSHHFLKLGSPVSEGTTENEFERQIGAESIDVNTNVILDHCGERRAECKDKALDLAIYIPTLTYGPEIWAVTKKKWIQVAWHLGASYWRFSRPSSKRDKTSWRHYSNLACGLLQISQEELEDVVEKRDIWTTLLSMLPLQQGYRRNRLAVKCRHIDVFHSIQ